MAAKKGPTKAELEALARQEMILRVRASVEAGRGKSMFETDDPETLNRFHGAMCRCGVRRKPGGLSRFVVDDGLCTVHPGRAAQPFVPGAGGKS